MSVKCSGARSFPQPVDLPLYRRIVEELLGGKGRAVEQIPPLATLVLDITQSDEKSLPGRASQVEILRIFQSVCVIGLDDFPFAQFEIRGIHHPGEEPLLIPRKIVLPVPHPEVRLALVYVEMTEDVKQQAFHVFGQIIDLERLTERQFRIGCHQRIQIGEQQIPVLFHPVKNLLHAVEELLDSQVVDGRRLEGAVFLDGLHDLHRDGVEDRVLFFDAPDEVALCQAVGCGHQRNDPHRTATDQVGKIADLNPRIGAFLHKEGKGQCLLLIKRHAFGHIRQRRMGLF